MTRDETQPLKEIRVGRMVATLWPNQNAVGEVWYSFQLYRTYFNGSEEKRSKSFSRDDALPLAELCRQVFLWIHDRPTLATIEEIEAIKNEHVPGSTVV